jgi:hypothetical protein
MIVAWRLRFSPDAGDGASDHRNRGVMAVAEGT